MDVKGLHDRIKARYSLESSAQGGLGCGHNLSLLALRSGERVLDLGCGRGQETLEAAKLVGEGGLAVGLDLTPEMVRAAVERAAVEGCVNVRFVVGDMERLPFPPESFDAVMSNCAINHARDKSRIYREVHRVLKTGGRFVISDPVTRYPLPHEIKRDPYRWAMCFGGAVTEQEYLQCIREAGFRRVEIINRREYLKNGYEFASLPIRAFKEG